MQQKPENATVLTGARATRRAVGEYEYAPIELSPSGAMKIDDGGAAMLAAEIIAAAIAAQRATVALGNSATYDVGTTAGTVAAGNDSRFHSNASDHAAGNVLINGGFDVSQYFGDSLITLGNSYSIDRWLLQAPGMSGLDRAASQRVGGGGESAATVYALRVTPSSQNPSGGIMQIVDAAKTVSLRGKTVVFNSRVRMETAPAKNFRVAILEWTGTADTGIVHAIVNNWASTNYTKGNFFSNDAGLATITGANVSVQQSVLDTSYANVSFTYTVSATANNLLVFIWKDAPTYDSVQWRITKCDLYIGAGLREWKSRTLAEETNACLYYYWQVGGSYVILGSGFFNGTTLAEGVIALPTMMRIPPSLMAHDAASMNTYSNIGNIGSNSLPAPAGANNTKYAVNIRFSLLSAGVSGNGLLIGTSSLSYAWFAANAEL